MEKTYNLLGIRPNGITMCRFKITPKSGYAIYMKAITEKEEERIDNAPKYYGEKRHVLENGIVIPAKDIYLYGEVDFDNPEDIENIKKYNIIDMNATNSIYSNIDWSKGTFTTIDNKSKIYSTYDCVTWFKYCYLLIGRPERIIVYKRNYSFK